MSFLNPAFLGLLGLVGIPLLIHLIRRRKQKIVRWAAMEFLRQSQKKQRRRLRIEELILLSLRMLIVAIAVLAFARPVLRALGIPLLSQNARIYAVIVLDNSYSMDFRDPNDGKRSFERAQAAADDILTHILKSGDSASLVLLSDKPNATVGAPTYDLNLVRQRVRIAKVGDRSTDYLSTAQAVDKLLTASRTPVKEVYWISDDQAPAWGSSKKDAAKSVWTDMGKQARVTWVSAGAPALSRDNLVVATPTLSSELVTPQLSARIESQIANHGNRPRSDLLVNLIVDGKPAASTRVTIAPNSVQTAHFLWRFIEPGTHTCRIELADQGNVDGLAHDNGASFVVRSRERIKVLVQDMRPTANPTQSESFYLMNAMAPLGAAESVAPKLREGAGFGDITLRDYDTIVIAGLSRLSANDRRALEEYVKGGGGLLIFPGPDTDVHSVNADLGAAGLLPAKLGTRRVLTDASAITLNPGSIRHPVFTLFKDTSVMHLDSARFTTYYPLEPESDEQDINAVQVMMRFSNNEPAFVERHVGLGKVILAASSADSTWSQLPLRPSFIPLVSQVLSYLGQGPTSHRNLRQDEALFLSLPLSDANKSVRVTDPDGHTTAQTSVLDARGVSFSYNTTSRAGLYRISVANSRTSDAFAVGLPAAEGDLAYADPTQSITEAGLSSSHLTVAARPSLLQASVRRARYGAEVWRPLIWLLVPLLFLESMLAQMWGRRG